MKLRNVRLVLGNVARTTNAKTMEAISTNAIRNRNSDGTFSEEVIGYAVDCAAYRGDTLKVKFPQTVKEKIEQIQALLQNDTLVEISFKNLKLTPYAMLGNDGTVLAGVSAKADDFEFTAKETDFDLDEIEI